MALKSYILTNDYKAPYVTATGLPHNPSAIRFKQYRKGEIIKGEMKHANNKPAFILVSGVCVVPLEAVKELITKEVISHADGEGSIKKKITDSVGGSSKANSNPKVRYLDALLLGSLIGFGGVMLAEKQGYITVPDKKYRLYGALGVGAIAMYVVYRGQTKKTKIKIKNEE
jgi:hypothetical protein|tara:strand:+ start:1838 stop:2350 length:513 start_codon:yes stop_codon:yes gene_type:complete